MGFFDQLFNDNKMVDVFKKMANTN